MYGSSGKIPDLVEHTQGADIYRDPSFKEALALQALALDSGHRQTARVDRASRTRPSASADSSPHKSNTRTTVTHSISDDVLQNVSPSKQTMGDNYLGINGGPKYIKNPDRSSSERTLNQHHREKSASTSVLSVPATQVSSKGESSQTATNQEEYQSSTLPRIRKEPISSHDGKHYPSEKGGDKIQLLTGLLY
jgi:hypothetical protein